MAGQIRGRDHLTIKGIAAAISKSAKIGSRIELSDGGGLVLRCSPSGVAKWSYAYRLRAAGGMRRLTFGLYGDKAPALSLKAARAARDTEQARNSAGGDPRAAQAREREVQAVATLTFADLCELYIENVRAGGKLSWKTDEGYLKRPITKFGKRAAISITKRDMIDLLKAIALISKCSANRTQSTLRTMWGWAADCDHIPMNFLAGVKKIGGKENEKDRVLTEAEIISFLAALSEPDVEATEMVCLALRGILLTAQRPGEVSGMMLSELYDLGGERPHWIIPKARTKNKKTEHTVPLSPSMVQLIGEALAANKSEEVGANDKPVFASRFESKATLARHSLSCALRRIVKAKGWASFTPHDLRRTGATLAQAARLPTDFVKALLNHNDKGVTGVYARWNMFEEKLEAVLAIESALTAH